MTYRLSVVALATFTAIALPPQFAHAKSGSDRVIYNCKERWEPNTTICKSENLRGTLAEIERRYASLKRSHNPDVAYLAPWDRYYFGLRVWNCRNAPYSPPEIPQCIKSAVQEKRLVLRRAITAQVLLDQIASSGSFDAGLVERYPQAFVGRAGYFCGDVVVRAQKGRLVGTFRDCKNGRYYPLEYQQTTNNDLAFFANNPSISSWFNGRFERRNGKLIFIAVPDMEAEAWWARKHSVQ